MSAPEDEFYTAERWQNWLERLEEEEIDLEDEDTARLRLNLLDDAVIAVAKIVTAYEDGVLDEDQAVDELAGVSEIVLSDVEFGDEDTTVLVEAVQNALHCVFYSAEEYVAGGATEGVVEEYVTAAVEAENDEDLEKALRLCVQAGTLIIDGQELDRGAVADVEYGYVADWVDGLDSLEEAMGDPEVIEEEEAAENGDG